MALPHVGHSSIPRASVRNDATRRDCLLDAVFRQLAMRRKMQSVAILAVTWVCAGFPVEAQHPELPAAEHPEIPDAGSGGPPNPREVIPVPVVPDKMAVPAPTVVDKIKKPGEPPAVRSGDPNAIPEPERKEVTPPARTPVPP
jgi:hypothetical protein